MTASDTGGAALAIHLSGVGVSVGGRCILDDVSWSLPVGARAALLGPNGCGKTTLLRAITGYLYPTDGSVEVLGRRLGQTDVQELRRHVGVVDPTSPWLFDEFVSTGDAVLTGFFGNLVPWFNEPTAEQRAIASAALRQVGLSGHESQPFPTLSTGERRRALLARALVQQPRLLVLDEPTAGLDLLARESLLATLDRIGRSDPTLTTLVVSHQLEDLPPDVSHVLLMAGGRASVSGRPEDVLTADNLTRAFGCPVEVGNRGGRWWWTVSPEAWQGLWNDPKI